MNAAANHNQGNARAASGELAFCGMGLPARIAGRDKFQFRRPSAPVERRFTIPLPLTGGASCPVLFIQTAGGWRVSKQRRRALGFLPRRLAVKFVCCALIGRSHQLYRIAHKLGSDRPNPFHRLNAFHGVTFHNPEHEPKGVGSAQESVGVFQNADC